jgi:hypothetical protein
MTRFNDHIDVAVVVPSHGRPDNAYRVLGAVWETAHLDTEVLLVVDADDETRSEYPNDPAVQITQTSGMVNALNFGAEMAAEWASVVAFFGDDHRPRTPGWDRRFFDALWEMQTGIVYGNDLLQGENMPTAVAMTSDIVRTLGYMAPPAFRHLNVDIVWREWGQRLDRLRYLDDVVIEHLHPAAGKAALDDGYLRVNSEEMVAADGEAWATYLYRDLEGDLERLRTLL